MNENIEFVNWLTQKGGPDVSEYYDLDAWIAEVAEGFRSGRYSGNDLVNLINAFGDAFSNDTMQGFAYNTPHGYAGDYEIIDRIYRCYVSANPRLENWDHYWQQHSAATAVRNRAGFFEQQVFRRCGANPEGQCR